MRYEVVDGICARKNKVPSTISKKGWGKRIKTGHGLCVLAFAKTVRRFLSTNYDKEFLIIFEDDVLLLKDEYAHSIRDAFLQYTYRRDCLRKSLSLGYFIPIILHEYNQWQNVFIKKVDENLFYANGLVDAHAVVYPRQMLEDVIDFLPKDINGAIEWVYRNKPYDLWFGLHGQYYANPLIFAQNQDYSDTERLASPKHPRNYADSYEMLKTEKEKVIISGLEPFEVEELF